MRADNGATLSRRGAADIKPRERERGRERPSSPKRIMRCLYGRGEARGGKGFESFSGRGLHRICKGFRALEEARRGFGFSCEKLRLLC